MEQEQNKNKTIKMSTFLTIAECQKIVKTLDPSSAVTDYFVRNLAKQGKDCKIPIKVVTAGKKKLMRLFDVLNYLGIAPIESLLVEDTTYNFENLDFYDYYGVSKLPF